VVELGAGTGKFTRALAGRVGSLIAVEPDPAMRAAFTRAIPGVEVIEGSGERIPLPAQSAEAVLAAQAWHWVDPDRAGPQVARVLTPGGRIGLVWNDRDEADPWIAVLTIMLADYGTNPDSGYEPVVGPLFDPLERREFRWSNTTTVQGVVDMVASRSYVIALGDADRETLVGRVRDHARDAASPTGQVLVPYVTRGYRARVRGSAAEDHAAVLDDDHHREDREDQDHA
jgi:SAM-dependent methyltransferase